MAAKTTAFDNALLQALFNNNFLTSVAQLLAVPGAPLANLYLALHTADPTVAAANQTVNEISYAGYGRVAVPRNSASFVPGSAQVALGANADFPACTGGASQTATHFSIGTALTGSAGIILYFGAITPNIVVSTGVIPRLTTASTVTES